MISIIIPTHNRAQLIPRAIKSVIDQSYKDWELIVVDDGSTDNTEKVVQEFLQDKRINYVKKDNTGAAHSRNVGVKKANGKFITFLDSDDEAKAHWLKTMNKAVNNNKCIGLVCCGCEIIDEKGSLMETKLPNTNNNLFGKEVVYKMTNGGVFLVKKEFFDKVGGYDDELTSGQHTELSFRLIPYLQEIGGQMESIAESLIKIHIHLGERIRGNPEMKFRGTKRTLEKHNDFFETRRKMRADYEGVLAKNALDIGAKTNSIRYIVKSFISAPNAKRFFRIPLYIAKNIIK